MRAKLPAVDIKLLALQLSTAPGSAHLAGLDNRFSTARDEVEPIIEEAAKFATSFLEPLNASADQSGARLEGGRVRTAAGHREAWAAFVEGGWPLLDHPEAEGGMALSLATGAVVQEVLDRSCPAFSMLAVPQRSAARLIRAYGDEAMRATWLPRLVSGECGATICVSEPDAGSDAGRIRTRAEPLADGSWAISGEKTWISFGDHDLTDQIVHCLLARTPGQPAGGRGLSLFLVPAVLEDGSRNSIVVQRIEEKMGLHGSPTCALGFEGARGWLLGSEGRGLMQMFVMIANMRLSVAEMGLGIASAAYDVAAQYATERKQGGPAEAPVPIEQHADVQRMLLRMAARSDTMRGLTLATANMTDIGAHSTDDAEAASASALAQWLLPIIKTGGGEIAFENASDALQILGGAGYTREWPVEQALRDSRVLTIFEGTTGIQALDLVQRRLVKGDRQGYTAFLQTARAAAKVCPDPDGATLMRALDIFEKASDAIVAMPSTRDIDAGATAYLSLAGLVATGWIAAHHIALVGDDPWYNRLRTTGRFHLFQIDKIAERLAAEATAGAARLDNFSELTTR